MTEPTPQPEPSKVREPTMPTEVMRGMHQLDSLNSQVEPVDPYPGEGPPVKPYVKERLFSRKVLAAWAAATLVVWFALSVIAPVIFESIKSAVVSSLEESATTRAAEAAAATSPTIPPEPGTPVDPAVAPVAPEVPATATGENPVQAVERERDRTVRKVIIRR